MIQDRAGREVTLRRGCHHISAIVLMVRGGVGVEGGEQDRDVSTTADVFVLAVAAARIVVVVVVVVIVVVVVGGGGGVSATLCALCHVTTNIHEKIDQAIDQSTNDKLVTWW